MGKPFKWVFNFKLLAHTIISLGLALSFSFTWSSTISAQGSTAFIQQVRVMEADKTGLEHPSGLAFSSRAVAFYAVEAPGQALTAATDFIKLAPSANRIGSARISAQMKESINITLDNKLHRLLVLQFPANQLLEVREKSDGSLDLTTLIRYDARSFGLQNPQGMTVDPASGTLFILDAAGPRIVRVEPGLYGSFTEAVVSRVNIKSSGLVAPRGLAFDPTTSHLFVISTGEKKLYEFTQSGQVMTYRDLSKFRLGNPQGMVLAPSGDQTDDPSQVSLYLADRGLIAGQILELALTQPPAAAASSFTASLVQTTNLAAISPPSPDPSGLTYLPLSNTLVMSDGEVEETVSKITHFEGANVWEMTLNGSIVHSANVSSVAPTQVIMSDEPNGVAWNSSTGHFYFTDDMSLKVYDLNPGADGWITAGDSYTSFSTGTSDPEGITYGGGHLFVADGDNREIYQFTIAGSLVNHFDVLTYGVVDPESVEFNSDCGTLFVLGGSASLVIIETDLNGNLLQTIDVSANNAQAPAGLAYAPASDGSGSMRFYIVDRGIDNNEDPNIIDGKMYEMSAPVSCPPARKPSTTTITSDLPHPSVVGETVSIGFGVVATSPGTGTPTGNVTVSDGTQSCSGSLSAGAGSCSIIFATPGTKSLTATYVGDTNFFGSASTPAIAHTVNKASTTTAIISDLPDPSVVGQAVTINFSVAVTAPGTGTPTGTVTVSDGTQSCSGSLTSGMGSCSIAFATPGQKSLTATYVGNTSFNASIPSPDAAHTVNKASTTTSITSDFPDPSVVGQAVTITYSVAVNSPGSGTPTGSVTVSDGTQSCSGTLTSGTGTCSIAFATPGTKSLTATYAGNTSFNASIPSPVAAHTVNKASTASSITSDLPDPSKVGQSVSVSFSVAVAFPGSGTPTGSVTVSDGIQSCSDTLTSGTGSCSISFATLGAKSLTATYSGDTNFNTITSATESHAVNGEGTTTFITNGGGLATNSVVGQSYQVAFSVTPATNGTPTGNVTVSDGSATCVGTVTSGKCDLISTTAGAKSLTASYSGDTIFSGSTSPVVAHNVDKGSTITFITSTSSDPSVVGQAVTINFSVAVTAPGTGTPTGTVTVSDGTQSCSGSLTSGMGSCSIAFATPGPKSLIATYAGNTSFNASIPSPVAAHTVNKASTTTSITSDFPDPSVIGQAVTITYSVAVNSPGTGTPTGTVTVSDGTQSCSGSLSSGVGSCSIVFATPGTKSLTATYAGNTSFNVSIPSPVAAHTVNKASTTTSITSDLPDSSVVGQTVTITYSVAVDSPGSGTPTGNVTVSDGIQSCSGNLSSGTGSCSISFATPGTKSLTATYAGDAIFLGSASDPVTAHTVNKASTTTSITTDLPDPSVVGQAVTITYSVAVNSPGSGTPAGTVIVSDGIQSCTSTVIAGSCSIIFTTSGVKSLTVTYTGDEKYDSSDSNEVLHTVLNQTFLPLVIR